MTAHTLKDLLQASANDTLAAGIGTGDTTFTGTLTPSDTNGSAGLAATPPYVVIWDRGTVNEETGLVTAVNAGTKVFTVTRDLSGTGAKAHALGATVKMPIAKRTLDDLIATLLANPMTTLGDLIVGGAAGAPTRVAKGSNNTVWGVDGAGVLGYKADPTGGGGGGTPTVAHAARYTTTAGQSIPNNTSTIVDFGTVDYDVGSDVTTGASWHFTCPVTGYYRCQAQVAWAALTPANGSTWRLFVFKNGSVVCALGRVAFTPGGTTSATPAAGGSALIKATAGDTLDFRVLQTQGTSQGLLTTAGELHCSISLEGS